MGVALWFGACVKAFSLIRRWWQGHPVVAAETAAAPPRGAVRGRVDHVIILGGTLSSLECGVETNAGLLFKLLSEGKLRADRTVYYEPGIQLRGWRQLGDIAQGRGLNKQIRRTYGWLASHYRAGDRIFLFGFSRGAFAVRSLAGVIDRVGLVQRAKATERAVSLAYRHYQGDPDSAAAKAFAAANCHPVCEIECLGVWDTVKALGIRLPLLWKLTEGRHKFHNHHLGASVRHGFHALALHETRVAFEPVMWETPPGRVGHIEQVWFRGAHGDVGGHVGMDQSARPLSNIPLVWMIERAESLGLAPPEAWRERFPCDASAPMVGTMRGWGAFFLLRRARVVGRDPSERLHSSAEGQRAFSWVPWPLTLLY
jgi:uncharacterized protein (DUF2235 family)